MEGEDNCNDNRPKKIIENTPMEPIMQSKLRSESKLKKWFS